MRRRCRPGEKLFEELFVDGEEYGRTRHEKIFVAMNGQDQDHGNENLAFSLVEQVDRLIELAQSGDEARVRQLLAEIVPEYQRELSGVDGGSYGNCSSKEGEHTPGQWDSGTVGQ